MYVMCNDVCVRWCAGVCFFEFGHRASVPSATLRQVAILAFAWKCDCKKSMYIDREEFKRGMGAMGSVPVRVLPSQCAVTSTSQVTISACMTRVVSFRCVGALGRCDSVEGLKSKLPQLRSSFTASEDAFRGSCALLHAHTRLSDRVNPCV